MFESLPADLTDPDAILARARERQAMRRAYEQAPEASRGPG